MMMRRMTNSTLPMDPPTANASSDRLGFKASVSKVLLVGEAVLDSSLEDTID